MKKFLCVLGQVMVLGILTGPAQIPPPSFGRFVGTVPAYQTNDLTTFSLDFPGGTPAELVKAIEEATHEPLNAIIPSDDTDIILPSLKMSKVVAPQLFAALEAASRQSIAYRTSNFGNSYSVEETDYGFKTADAPVTDSSIWYFFVNRPTLPPMVSTQETCQFYQLQPYLNRGFTVDDITTAIQTGWKMAGITSPPELDYHKQTNLLIAFGKPEDLQTIQNVLISLPGSYVNYDKLESRLNELEKKIAALATNSPANSSGK